LKVILKNLIVREMTQTTENLVTLRKQIDELDNDLLELLAQRMRISKEIGTYKKAQNMPILQAKRYEEMLEKRIKQADEMGINGDFMKTILVAIHEESVKQQMEIM